jgi:gliding motility-associated-like protein
MKNYQQAVLIGWICALYLPLWGQFQVNGAAEVLNDSCYQLTPEQPGQAGSIWNTTQINLNESFEVIMEITLGCRDLEGADGMVFGFQPVSTSVGQSGGGIGFEGIAPSLGIEFDTYQNTNQSDPEFDHLALIRDGNLNHVLPSNLAGPVRISAGKDNVEDCSYHELRVSWNALERRLIVYFDCEERINYQGEIVNSIFGGDPLVYWGFTAATGAFANLQAVCFSYTSFDDRLEDVTLCPNGSIQLQASGGQAYAWSPALGLNNTSVPNPTAAPNQTTTYTVTIWDHCNLPFYDSLTVFVDGDTSFVNLGPDTSICESESLLLNAFQENASYSWSTGDTSATLTVQQTGLYGVTVTLDNYCVDSDNALVEVFGVPDPDLPQSVQLCEGASFTLDATVPGNAVDYLWQDGVTESKRTISQPGTYSVLITNECGREKHTIFVARETCREVYFPNAFSPNFDGLNDYFYPQDGNDVDRILSLVIFDRWGETVYSVTNLLPDAPLNGWDGTFRGKPMPIGVYTWIAEIRFRDGLVITQAGDINLLR